MLRVFAFWGVLCAMLVGFLAHELTDGRTVSASGGETAAEAPAVQPTEAPPVSNAELRNRYNKRMQDLAKAKEAEALAAPGAAMPSEHDVQRLHTALKEREKKLSEREEALTARERELTEKQSFLDQQLGKYETTLSKLRTDLKALEGSRDEKIAAFRQVYEKMEPKKAARILDDLDSDLAGRVLAGMKQQQAAEILGKMDPEKARRITKRFLSSVIKTPSSTTILNP